MNGSDTALIRPAVTIGVAATTPAVTDVAAMAQRSYGGVKLDLYDGTTSLETFLAAIENFATFDEWTEVTRRTILLTSKLAWTGCPNVVGFADGYYASGTGDDRQRGF